MTTIITLGRAAALLLGIPSAWTPATASQQCDPPPATAAAADVRTLSREYIEAARTNNVSWFQSHMAEDVVILLNSGRKVLKPEFLAMVKQEPKSYTKLTARNVTVVPVGATVRVEAEGVWELSDGSNGVVRYVDTYIWLDCRWQVSSAQIASLPPPVVRKRRYRRKTFRVLSARREACAPPGARSTSS